MKVVIFFFPVPLFSLCGRSVMLTYLLHDRTHHRFIATFGHEWPNRASAGCDRGTEGGREERLISSQLQRGGVRDAPAADNGSLSLPVACNTLHYTHIHTQALSHARTHTQTQTYKLWSSCISTPFMDNKRLSERVCSHSVCVCAHKLLKQNMIIHTPASVVLAVALCVCVLCVLAYFA